MKTSRIAIWALCCMALLTTGCASYYRVTEPVSGKNYYTNYVEHNGGGSIYFEDDKSGATVTLQSSEVLEITDDEFRRSTRK